MDDRILVQDMRDPRSICAALQQALDVVTSPDSIQDLLASPLSSRPGIVVDWHPEAHALASVDAVCFQLEGRYEVILHFTMYRGDPQAGTSIPYPPGFMERLRVVFRSQNGVQMITQPLRYSGGAGGHESFRTSLRTPRAAYQDAWEFKLFLE